MHWKKQPEPETLTLPNAAASGWQAMPVHPTDHGAGSVPSGLLSRWACLPGFLDVEGLDLVDVLLQVKGDGGRVQGLCHLTPTERLLVAIVGTAKLEAMQEDMQSLRIASWFTMGLPCVFFAAHALTCSQDVIHVDAEDTVHHVVVALVLEHLKGGSPSAASLTDM